jgi:hypothetical protein
MVQPTRASLLLALPSILLAAGGCSRAAPVEPADLILENARVYTLAWDEPATDGTPASSAPFAGGRWSPDAEAVAIAGDRIVFVGSRADVQAYRGDATEVIDLAGATVLPGLVDSHTHVPELGERLNRVDLTGVATEEEAIARAVAFAANVPKGEWIVGRGWDEGAWASRYPTWDRLSAALPDHPVFLGSLHGFAGWGNALAFERAGITRTTPNPVGGEILKDRRGHPTGIVLNRAVPLLADAVPPATDDQYRKTVRAGLQVMADDGYVAVHEAGVDARLLRAFQALDAEGALPVRVYAMLSARDADLCREWLRNGPDAGEGRRLTVRSVKAYYDGALGSRGARLLEDYSDRADHRGVSGEGYGFDQALVADMMKAGFQVGIHAIGDAGNRETFEFVERVLAEHPAARAARHRIEHAQVVNPDDVGRFARSDIIAAMQPPHAVEDMVWAEERLGPDRVKGAYAWRTLRQHGARLMFSSDLTGSDHDIFYGLHAAITRRDKQRQPPAGWYPAERMTSEEALRGYTTWAAYGAHWEAETGVIAPGRWADLTVMDIDPLALGTTDPGKLLDGRIRLTVVGGKVEGRH